MPEPELNQATDVWFVLAAALITALCTGLGALPLMFIKDISRRTLGLANSLAAGLMLGASIGLVYEGAALSGFRTGIGVAVGVALILLVRLLIPHEHESEESLPDQLAKSDFRKILMIMVVMTAHSFAEGIGVGVSFGGREGLGQLITVAISIHNIPEGLAIGLVMIPRGVSVFRASMWGIFSSLPQPIMAVPAFLFVLSFAPWLPIGLGLAAGAMVYMVFFEIFPEALEEASPLLAYSGLAVASLGMVLFQWLL